MAVPQLAQRTSTMARLCAETYDLMNRVEAEHDLLDSRTSWLDYRLYLFRMFGFHSTIEQAIAAVPGLRIVLPDTAIRSTKVALLGQDLVSLGVAHCDLAQLPQMPVPSLELPEALGWLYVVEAATLRGRDLAARLAAQLPLEMESASAYFRCYGDDVETKWDELGDAVDAYTQDEGTGERVIAGALDCLTRLHRWLRPAAVPSRLHA